MKRLLLALAAAAPLLLVGHSAATPNPHLVRVMPNWQGGVDIWLHDHRLFYYDWNGRLQVARLDQREQQALIDALDGAR